MQLSHSRDNSLSGFLVGLNPEGRIFIGQFVQSIPHLFLVGLGFRLNCQRYNRLRESDGLQHYPGVLITQGISRSPTKATISPAKAWSISSRLLACIKSIRDTLSSLSLVEL